jgi:hypothetical protein
MHVGAQRFGSQSSCGLPTMFSNANTAARGYVALQHKTSICWPRCPFGSRAAKNFTMRRFWVITEPRDTSTMQGIWLCTWEFFFVPAVSERQHEEAF